MPMTARRILFLCSSQPASNDNFERLQSAFAATGWNVFQAPPESLALVRGELRCAAGELESFDRIWQLGFGPQISFFDRMQMLSTMDPERFVTTPEALLKLHGKFRWLEHMPETHISNDPAHLLALTGQGGDWVLKPTAGSFGRNVSLLRGQRPHGAEATQSGPSPEDILSLEEALAQATQNGAYAVLQRYLPEVTAGETRVLSVAGQLVGWYLRIPTSHALALEASASPTPYRIPLANRTAGATAQTTELMAPQRRLAQRIANELLALGVGFAAIDLIGNQLIEVNIANPGGLARLAELAPAAAEPATRVVAALEALWD